MLLMTPAAGNTTTNTNPNQNTPVSTPNHGDGGRDNANAFAAAAAGAANSSSSTFWLVPAAEVANAAAAALVEILYQLPEQGQPQRDMRLGTGGLQLQL